MTTPTVPASIRNCNPGAIYPGPSARRFGATSEQALVSQDGRHRIASFPDAISGAAALFDNLAHARPDRRSPYYYRDKRLADAIATWCGAIHATSYLRSLEVRAGLEPDTVLSLDFLRDPDRVVPLAKAMAWHEAGRPYPLADGGWQAAHDMALAHMPQPTAVPPVPPTPEPTIPVHEADEPRAWTPDNDMPSPRPETRVETAFAGSRKWSLLQLKQRILVALGLGTGSVTLLDVADAAPPLLSRLKALAADNAVLLLLAGIVLGLVLVETVKLLARSDVVEGRYRPRREEGSP